MAGVLLGTKGHVEIRGMRREQEARQWIRQWAADHPNQAEELVVGLLEHYFIALDEKGREIIDPGRQPSPADTDQVVVQLLTRTTLARDLVNG